MRMQKAKVLKKVKRLTWHLAAVLCLCCMTAALPLLAADDYEQWYKKRYIDPPRDRVCQTIFADLKQNQRLLNKSQRHPGHTLRLIQRLAELVDAKDLKAVRGALDDQARVLSHVYTDHELLEQDGLLQACQAQWQALSHIWFDLAGRDPAQRPALVLSLLDGFAAIPVDPSVVDRYVNRVKDPWDLSPISKAQLMQLITQERLRADGVLLASRLGAGMKPVLTLADVPETDASTDEQLALRYLLIRNDDKLSASDRLQQSLALLQRLLASEKKPILALAVDEAGALLMDGQETPVASKQAKQLAEAMLGLVRGLAGERHIDYQLRSTTALDRLELLARVGVRYPNSKVLQSVLTNKSLTDVRQDIGMMIDECIEKYTRAADELVPQIRRIPALDVDGP